MKPDRTDIDGLLEQHLPSASAQQVENAGMRVLHRLRTHDQPETGALEAHLDDIEVPVATGRGTAIAWMAAAAALTVAIGTAILWQPSDHVAVVTTVDASLSREVDGKTETLPQGSDLETGQPVRTTADAGAVLQLADGSSVEMRSRSELAVEKEADGLGIRLHQGSIIVNAAKQRSGHLYVKTKDVTVSVVGTVFMVNAETGGSRVGVIEGEVRVREGTKETSLTQGQQVTTSTSLITRPLKEEIAWSRNIDAHLRILESFARGMAQTAAPLALSPKTPRGSPQGAGGAGAAAASREFEEASIRQCDPDNLPDAPVGARGGGANSFQMTPGRTHALCMTLATLIRTAYGYAPGNFFTNGGRGRGLNVNNVYGLGVEDGLRVRGGPDWVRSERYTIDAVAAEAADPASMSGPMLLALLEKRFQLQAHIESEQIPAFDLTVAPGGLKIKEGTCTPPEPGAVPPRSTMEVVRKNLEAARRGGTTAAPCGLVFAVNGPNLLNVSAGAGVPPLSGVLGVPVTDRTGIPSTTRFNYVLEFSPDDSTNGPLGRVLTGPPDIQIAPDPSAVPKAPNIFTAIEEQLGLKLVPSRYPREFIVIDRVERPTAN